MPGRKLEVIGKQGEGPVYFKREGEKTKSTKKSVWLPHCLLGRRKGPIFGSGGKNPQFRVDMGIKEV